MKILLAALVGVALATSTAQAEPINSKRIFTSSAGRNAFEVVWKVGEKARAVPLPLRLEDRGHSLESRVVTLNDVPRRVLVPPEARNPFLVTLDSYFLNVPYLLIYRDGIQTHKLFARDLLAAEEIKTHVMKRTGPGHWQPVLQELWREDTAFSFEVPYTSKSGYFLGTPRTFHPEQTRLHIHFAWGKHVVVELATGKVITVPQAQTSEPKVHPEAPGAN